VLDHFDRGAWDTSVLARLAVGRIVVRTTTISNSIRSTVVAAATISLQDILRQAAPQHVMLRDGLRQIMEHRTLSIMATQLPQPRRLNRRSANCLL
jgi:uncharacterized protein (UPF0216 family)